jgi:hypothetical protein
MVVEGVAATRVMAVANGPVAVAVAVPAHTPFSFIAVAGALSVTAMT